MTIPDPTPEQQIGIDAAVAKANAARKPDSAPYTSESYQLERIQQMRDSWASAVAQETGNALLQRALALPLEQRQALIALVEQHVAPPAEG